MQACPPPDERGESENNQTGFANQCDTLISYQNAMTDTYYTSGKIFCKKKHCGLFCLFPEEHEKVSLPCVNLFAALQARPLSI